MSKKTKKATVRTPVKELRKGETIGHYNAVLLEDIRSKMELVVEGMEGTKVSLREGMHNLDRKLTGEIELLKGVVHKHSSEIGMLIVAQNSLKNSIKELAIQVAENNKNIKELRESIGDNAQKIGALQGQVGQMENRIIDVINTRMDDHEVKPVAVAHPAQ